MARRKPTVRGANRPNPRVRSTRTVPLPNNMGHGVDWASGETAKAEATREMDALTAQAIEQAREGDDSILLPYQPTPSINPPRPRTLAAGYDSRTKTLRVRFRDGVGYEYYNVPPRVWQNFKKVKSPGRAINRYFGDGQYKYARADW